MKTVKEKETGNLARVPNEKAAEMVKSGLFTYSTKGRWKSAWKEFKRFQRIKRFKNRVLPAFGSGKKRKLEALLEGFKQETDERGGVTIKKRVSVARNAQLQAEARNKKIKSRK